MHVFLDLWGVLLDSDRMQRDYGQRLARRMMERFGGDEARWTRSHTAAWTGYVQAVESTDWSRRSWASTADDLDARFSLELLEGAGVVWRPPDPVAFARELEREVMSTVDARFPDAHVAVDRLRAAGHRVYVATQATESNARGALAGAGLLGALDGVFTGTSQDAPKDRPAYWERIPKTIGAVGSRCLLVDDRVDYLGAAARTGFVGLLLDREEVYASTTPPPFVRATLRTLAGLPHYVDVIDRESAHTST